jgi:hypothetical protein
MGPAQVIGKEALLTYLVKDQYHIVIFNNTEIGQRALLKMTMDIADILYQSGLSQPSWGLSFQFLRTSMALSMTRSTPPELQIENIE